MRTIYILLSGLFFLINFALMEGCGQALTKTTTKIGSFIRESDSVILVFHENSNSVSGETILVDGKLNKSIIKRTVTLSATEKERLGKILARRPKGLSESATCFDPHHTIAIYRLGRCYPVELCFGCRNTRQPSKIKLSYYDFDDRKWEELSKFFSNRNLLE
jgi:hypothetical protein